MVIYRKYLEPSYGPVAPEVEWRRRWRLWLPR